ncbi:MAG TPA: flavin reductase family protein [Sulfurovum sp.]|uniref:flavin reductase family protein n=1 Tax=Sulfurovum sp. TaxID=1969726 RepID=UPI002F93493D
MFIDFEESSTSERYHLMANTVVPRPIAWVVTEGEVLNIAPFSYFTPLSSDPATLMISIGHRPDGRPKDTLRNLRESRKCVVCIVDGEHFEAMHRSSKGLEASESELEVFDIPVQGSLEGFPPMPAGIKVAFLCEYLQEVDLKGSKTIPVIVEIQHLYLDDAIISDKAQIGLEFSAIARVGRSYSRIDKIIPAPEIP